MEGYKICGSLYTTRMEDSLATPVNKLPSVSTRENKPSGGDVSYADILKQQEMERQHFDQQQQQGPLEQPQFQEPSMGHGAEFQNPYLQPPPPTPMQQGQYAAPPMQQQQMYMPQYPQHPPMTQGTGDDPAASPPTKWWRTWLLHNKTGWIVAFVTFLILTFVYPKIRSMTRFQGLPLPYWVTGALAVAAAGSTTAIDISL